MSRSVGPSRRRRYSIRHAPGGHNRSLITSPSLFGWGMCASSRSYNHEQHNHGPEKASATGPYGHQGIAIVSLCAKTSTSTHCLNSPSTSESNGFLGCSAFPAVLRVLMEQYGCQCFRNGLDGKFGRGVSSAGRESDDAPLGANGGRHAYPDRAVSPTPSARTGAQGSDKGGLFIEANTNPSIYRIPRHLPRSFAVAASRHGSCSVN